MSVSCNTFPTATNTVEITTSSLSTTSSAVVTTEPPTTTTLTTTLPCPPVTGSVTATCIPVTSTTVITSPGSVHTTFVPVTVAVPVTTTTPTTLYGSSCTTITTPNPGNEQTPSPLPPTPTVITTQSSSTQPNGSVVVQTVVVTSTAPGGASPTNLQNPNNNDSSSNIAPIVGGVVGGFFGLIAIVLLVWFIIKRRRRWDDIWETDEDIAAALDSNGNNPRRDMLQSEMKPKPYEYGLLGKAQPPTSSPPQSPFFGPTRADHNRSSSTAPLLTPMSAALQMGSGATISSRPSTGGSIQPLTASSQQSPQMQEAPLQPQRLDMARAGPSNMTPANSVSSASIGSPSVSLLNWTGNMGPSFNESLSMGPSSAIAANAVPGPSNAHPPSPSTHAQSTDRVGSPMSVFEQRRLQVANAPVPMSPQAAEFDPYGIDMAAASAAAMTTIPASVPQPDGKGRFTMPTGGSKTPIVHLDGGRIQNALNIGRPATTGPSPPAYEA